jgi:hypothetical protein
MSQILKPKHLSTYVPGFGVINKADFSNEHLEACVKQVKDTGGDVDAYMKSRFESFNDTSIAYRSSADRAYDAAFNEPKKSKGKKKVSDDEELERLIAEEEKAKTSE